jgi:PleD family two-component response regulator
LLLPDTSCQVADEALSRVASEVMNTCSSPDGRSITISWGIAELTDGITSTELLAQADLALMAHKRRKAQVEVTERVAD